MTDETTVNREYQSLLAIKDNFEKIVVSLDDLPQPTNQGIKNISAWELDGYLSLID